MIVGALVGALVWALAPVLARLERERPWWCVGLIAFGVLLAELANGLILVRLYPAFHLGVGGPGVLLTLPFAAEALHRALGLGLKRDASNRAAARAAAITLGAWLLAALLVLPSAQRLAHFDNFRFVVSEHAPLAGRAVELATSGRAGRCRRHGRVRLAQPAERAAHAACQAPSSEANRGPRSISGSAIFLLISVDALRADHLGSYGLSAAHHARDRTRSRKTPWFSSMPMRPRRTPRIRSPR